MNQIHRNKLKSKNLLRIIVFYYLILLASAVQAQSVKLDQPKISIVANEVSFREIKKRMPTLKQEQFQRIGKQLRNQLVSNKLPNVMIRFDDAPLQDTKQIIPAKKRLWSLGQRTSIKTAIRETRTKLLRELLNQSHELDITHHFNYLPYIVVRPDHLWQLQRLLEIDDVLYIEVSSESLPALAESLPIISQPLVISSPDSITGSGQTVVVLDSGVDYTRPEFGACTAPGVPASCRVIFTQDFAPEDSQLDDDGHGTEMSGIIASVAPDAKLIVLDVFDGELPSEIAVNAAVDWIAENAAIYNIVAVNLSFSTGGENTQENCDFPGEPPWNIFPGPYYSALSLLDSNGILAIAPTGNNSYINGIGAPACISTAVAVGSVNDSLLNISYASPLDCDEVNAPIDSVSCFSNSSVSVDLLAPGALIDWDMDGASTVGTSNSSAFVTGAVALIKQAFPISGIDEVKMRLRASKTMIVDQRNNLSFPRLDLMSALDSEDTDGDGLADVIDSDPGDPCIPSLESSNCAVSVSISGYIDLLLLTIITLLIKHAHRRS